MVSTNHDDFEGDFLKEFKVFYRKKIFLFLIVAVLDLHANVSENMIKYSTCVMHIEKILTVILEKQQ